MKLKITHIVESVVIVDHSAYPNMTIEEAAEYERTIEAFEFLESVLGDDDASITTVVEIIGDAL